MENIYLHYHNTVFRDGKLNFKEFAGFLESLYNGSSSQEVDEKLKRGFMQKLDTNQVEHVIVDNSKSYNI